MDSIIRAYVDAIEAVNASASVYNMVVEIDAAAFAHVHAFAALDAFVGVNLNLEYREAADESESGSYGTHCIA